jgi:hypothetical protein
MVWLSAVVSGVVASLITVLVNNWFQNRREERAWQRNQERWLLEQRLRHYIEILEYVTNLRRVARNSGLVKRQDAADLFAESRDLNLRIRLMSSSSVREGWKPLLKLVENWYWGNIADPTEEREKLWRLSDSFLDKLRGELTGRNPAK